MATQAIISRYTEYHKPMSADTVDSAAAPVGCIDIRISGRQGKLCAMLSKEQAQRLFLALYDQIQEL